MKTAIPDIKDVEMYAFTFGSGQQHEGCYVVIKGSFMSAREKMHKRFGNKWSHQYRYNLEFLEIAEKWNWKEM